MNKLLRHAGYSWVCFGITLCAPGMTLAQAASTPADSQQPYPSITLDSDPALATTDDPVELEVLKVTGDNLERDQLRSAAAVSIISGNDIEKTPATSVYEVLSTTPNAQVQDGRFGLNSFSIRGVNSNGPSTLPTTAQYGTTTAIVLDGVALPRYALALSDLSAYGLDQVEVLRGPQSTSIGRNALAGAVVIRSLTPEPYWQQRGRLQALQQGGHQIAAALQLPLSELRNNAFSILVDQRDNTGDLNNITRNEDDFARDDNQTLRASLSWELSPDYRLRLTASEATRTLGSRYLEQSNAAARAITSNGISRTESTNRMLALHQKWELSPQWQLLAQTGWLDADIRILSDYDYTAEPGAFLDSVQDARMLSQELRLQYSGSQHRWVVGAYAYDSNEDEDQLLLVDLPTFARVAGVCPIAQVCALLAGNNTVTRTQLPTDNRNYALFGEWDYRFRPDLTLTMGLRYDWESLERLTRFESSGETLLAQAAVTTLQTVGVVGSNGDFPVDFEFDAWLPKLALVYEAWDQVFLSASARRGYRAGGAARNLVGGFDYSFEPEFTNNYELGLKARLGSQLELSTQVFYIDWQDQQVATGVGTELRVENAGRSTIQGIESVLRWRPFHSLDIALSAGYLDARFDEFVNAQDEDLSGNRLPFSSPYNGSLTLNWQPWGGLFIRPQLVVQGDGFSGPENTSGEAQDSGPLGLVGGSSTEDQRIDSRQVLNLMAGYQWRSLEVFVSATNLTDEQYRTDAYFNVLGDTQVAALGIGRFIGGGLQWTW